MKQVHQLQDLAHRSMTIITGQLREMIPFEVFRMRHREFAQVSELSLLKMIIETPLRDRPIYIIGSTLKEMGI